MRWALGIIITLIMAILAYVLFKNNREYKQALIELKDTLAEARQAAMKQKMLAKKPRNGKRGNKQYF